MEGKDVEPHGEGTSALTRSRARGFDLAPAFACGVRRWAIVSTIIWKLGEVVAFQPRSNLGLSASTRGTNHIAVGGTVIGVYLIFGREVTQRLTVRRSVPLAGCAVFRESELARTCLNGSRFANSQGPSLLGRDHSNRPRYSDAKRCCS